MNFPVVQTGGANLAEYQTSISSKQNEYKEILGKIDKCEQLQEQVTNKNRYMAQKCIDITTTSSITLADMCLQTLSYRYEIDPTDIENSIETFDDILLEISKNIEEIQ